MENFSPLISFDVREKKKVIGLGSWLKWVRVVVMPH